MIEASNPFGVGWVDVVPDSMGGALGAMFSGHGLYQPVEAPACGLVLEVPPAETTDGVERRFVCDRPAGHGDHGLGPIDKHHRHIYTEPAELERDGHDVDQAWWTALTWPEAAPLVGGVRTSEVAR